MPQVTLPDDSVHVFDYPLSVAELARSIASSLAKTAIAARVNGRLVDVSFMIHEDARLHIMTERDPEALEIIRHSSAHLLAHAVKQLYPEAQVTIGPVIEDGFYYDFSYHRPFTPEDLSAIETRMGLLVKENLPIYREECSRNDAICLFKNMGEHYKAEIITSIPEDQVLSLYRQGDFVDLCRGPHVPSTGFLKVFKLMKVAGAYWRGDSKNEMLQRIYGTAWLKKEDLQHYLHMLEEAEKRDHRRVGKHMQLFHLQDEAPGMVFWHPKGWALWQEIEQYIRRELRDEGYQEIRTPAVVDKTLWERSGHAQMYGEHMFITESEKRDYAIKPMSCPCHVQVFNQGLKSYRDLPLRLSEFGSCHRNEPSGALHGIMRVRGFVQDDAHIFCTQEQIRDEARRFIHLLQKVYARFGFEDILIRLSTRPEQRVGEDDLWDEAEEALADVLVSCGLNYDLQEGEGAFYGPKIEFTLKDNLGRLWQCGTLQLDFNLPVRLGAEYMDEHNTRRAPMMLHRAILGSFERFIGILIEHHAGAFPLWLAPVQVVIMNVTDAQADYAQTIYDQLRRMDFRSELDVRREKISYKIREHSLQKVPYQLIVGDQERLKSTVAVRARGGCDLGGMTLDHFVAHLKQELG